MHRSALFLLLAACGPSDGPVLGSMPCGGLTIDVWRVEGTAGTIGGVTASVDTVAPTTAFDPEVWITDVNAWGDSPETTDFAFDTAIGDEDFTCTHAPPSGRCPQAIWTLEAQEDLSVIVYADASCAGPTAGYELTVQVEGVERTPVYVGQADFFDTSLF